MLYRPSTAFEANRPAEVELWLAVRPRDNSRLSAAHVLLHPSPLVVFPSSHVSVPPTMPSPHRTAHAPALQLWPLAQAVAEKPSPSVLHTCRAVVLAHTVEALPGEQTRSVQVPAPVQA